MGIFSSVLALPAKLRLIRSLLTTRAVTLDGASEADVQHLFIRQIEGMTTLQLLSTPEATVLTIMESLADLTNQGVPVGNALFQIERARASIAPGRGVPEPHDPVTYIAYRVVLEHGGDWPGIGDAWYRRTMLAASQHFAYPIRETDLYVPPPARQPDPFPRRRQIEYVAEAPPPPPLPLPPAQPAPLRIWPAPAPGTASTRRLVGCPECSRVIMVELMFGAPTSVHCWHCHHDFVSPPGIRGSTPRP